MIGKSGKNVSGNPDVYLISSCHKNVHDNNGKYLFLTFWYILFRLYYCYYELVNWFNIDVKAIFKNKFLIGSFIFMKINYQIGFSSGGFFLLQS